MHHTNLLRRGYPLLIFFDEIFALNEEVNEITKNEYYKVLDEVTAYGDCDRCSYGKIVSCNLQCRQSYEDWLKEVEKLDKELGLI